MHNPGQSLSDDLYFSLPLVLHELEGREEALMEIAVIRACHPLSPTNGRSFLQIQGCWMIWFYFSPSGEARGGKGIGVSASRSDFIITGLKTIAGSGDLTLREGLATHVYTANANMDKRTFVNSDRDFCIVPQQGILDIQTEFGPLFVQPGEIAVIQRGQRFRVEISSGPSRGYILEIWGANFELPELGPLGANGLANARDFLHPIA